MDNVKRELTLNELMKSSYKLTETVLSDLKNAFYDDLTIIQACLEAGITTETYYQWLKQSDEFASIMDRAQNDLKIKARKVLRKQIDANDPEMAKWLLERREKKLYSQRTELTGEEGEKLIPVVDDPEYLEFMKDKAKKEADKLRKARNT